MLLIFITTAKYRTVATFTTTYPIQKPVETKFRFYGKLTQVLIPRVLKYIVK